jgi:ankyrin repeat protein
LASTKRVVNARVPHGVCENGWTALHECIRLDKKDMLEAILNQGQVKVDIKDGDGETPLFVASSGMSTVNAENAALLIQHGANVNFVASDGFSCLMMAARDGSLQVLKHLLDAGASNYNGHDMFGRTALDLLEFFATGQGGICMQQGESEEQARARCIAKYQLMLQYVG